MPTVKKQRPKGPRRRSKSSIASRIQPVSLKDNSIKMNVYGRTGTGKTTFACTFPKPLLLVGFEDGTKSVHNVKGVDFIDVRSTDDVKRLVDHVGESSKYKTVVADTLTGLQDLCLREILEIEKLPAQGSWGMASQQDWSQCALQTKEYLRALLELDANVLILAQERDFNTDTEGDVVLPYVGAAASPSVTGWLNPACDYVVQAFIRESTKTKRIKVGKKTVTRQIKSGDVEWCIRTKAHPVYTVKFRVPKGTELPQFVSDPSYQKILKLIEGN